jgi:type IV pilus assembly protein PilQ
MTRIVSVVIALLVAAGSIASAQTSGMNPAERKAFREYTSPQELVSIGPTTSMDKALAAISEVSQKFVGKVIIDPERRNMPINIDIQGTYWREALEQICRSNDIWYTEYENYIQLTGGTGTTGDGRQMTGGPAGGAQSVEIQREVASFRSREIKVSAVVFLVDLTRTEEVGVNWSFMKSTSDLDFAAEFNGADNVSTKIFKTELTPKVSFANMTFLLNLFSDYKLGEILAQPQLTVRSGEEGRIQVGEDFSIRERDFAGNLIDKFYSAGTIVKVTPQVISEQGVNFVHLVVSVEKSAVTPGQVSTIINKAVATTNLLLLDGEETIIGGLYSTEPKVSRQGVPFLKDLPWYVFGLRYLFGYERTDEVKKEVVILLKADLVPTLQERIAQRSKDENLINKWREENAKRELKYKPQ